MRSEANDIPQHLQGDPVARAIASANPGPALMAICTDLEEYDDDWAAEMHARAFAAYDQFDPNRVPFWVIEP
jgi:hypothetical protein